MGLKKVWSNKITGPTEFWVSTKSGSIKSGWGVRGGGLKWVGGDEDVQRDMFQQDIVIFKDIHQGGWV